jgi:hypothetical protein
MLTRLLFWPILTVSQSVVASSFTNVSTKPPVLSESYKEQNSRGAPWICEKTTLSLVVEDTVSLEVADMVVAAKADVVEEDVVEEDEAAVIMVVVVVDTSSVVTRKDVNCLLATCHSRPLGGNSRIISASVERSNVLTSSFQMASQEVSAQSASVKLRMPRRPSLGWMAWISKVVPLKSA